jgi:hypothetical protein
MKKIQSFLAPAFVLAIALPLRADAPNLITNGDFEQMKDGVPVGWSTPSLPGLAQNAFPTEPERGQFAQVELLRSGDKGAYFGQSVKVVPHTRYRLSLLARMNKGKITVAVGGGTGENKLSVRLLGEPSTRLPMTPLFWDADWYKNLSFVANQWRPVSLEFDSGELSHIAIAFGAYFTAGNYSFDDVSLVEIGPSAAQK